MNQVVILKIVNFLLICFTGGLSYQLYSVENDYITCKNNFELKMLYKDSLIEKLNKEVLFLKDENISLLEKYNKINNASYDLLKNLSWENTLKISLISFGIGVIFFGGYCFFKPDDNTSLILSVLNEMHNSRVADTKLIIDILKDGSRSVQFNIGFDKVFQILSRIPKEDSKFVRLVRSSALQILGQNRFYEGFDTEISADEIFVNRANNLSFLFEEKK